MPDFSVAGSGTAGSLATASVPTAAVADTGARAGTAVGRDAAFRAGLQTRASAHNEGRNKVRMQTVLAILAGS
ncbi:hypothetical protein XPR_0509 [Xanthomonas arboricola pv. pruni MAFF 301420]|uniref:Uncharacterized protein n=2 Tax=Xanthomonas arboricola pv. pruni TaxID=69929 RepID=W4SD92_9XANT|nr:hypothetical protein XPU_3880 [Xanthomonas arboricola pv. pruni str. MAFF 311562]GAE53874.1 hypothetical protein XPR_0509 [Xanthomonas arboricola pv. pruni MAFF 301420]GAE59917.1 hypothetical protein XPN_1823 [Xanthomonas arboricola pv. pruni MAFF 301427]